MRVKKIKKRPEECNISTVKVTEMGHFTELKYMQHKNNAQNVRMLPGGEECLLTSTGKLFRSFMEKHERTLGVICI